MMQAFVKPNIFAANQHSDLLTKPLGKSRISFI